MFGRFAFRSLPRQSIKTAYRRMGGHAPPPTDGLDGAVRKFLPEDEHVVLGILGFYFSVYLISKGVSALGGKKVPALVPTSSSQTTLGSAGIPSVDSPDFDKWISTPGNAEKLFS